LTASGSSANRVASMLGPEDVGQRVVIRRILRDRTGPTGGAAFGDILGVLEQWDAEHVVIRPSDGDPVRVPFSDVHRAKRIPPPPPPRPLRSTA